MKGFWCLVGLRVVPNFGEGQTREEMHALARASEDTRHEGKFSVVPACRASSASRATIVFSPLSYFSPNSQSSVSHAFKICSFEIQRLQILQKETECIGFQAQNCSTIILERCSRAG
mgnify:FL=1